MLKEMGSNSKAKEEEGTVLETSTKSDFSERVLADIRQVGEKSEEAPQKPNEEQNRKSDEKADIEQAEQRYFMKNI